MVYGLICKKLIENGVLDCKKKWVYRQLTIYIYTIKKYMWLGRIARRSIDAIDDDLILQSFFDRLPMLFYLFSYI